MLVNSFNNHFRMKFFLRQSYLKLRFTPGRKGDTTTTANYFRYINPRVTIELSQEKTKILQTCHFILFRNTFMKTLTFGSVAIFSVMI